VVVQRSASAPLVTLRVVFQAGSADDPAGQEGATHVTARLLAEGGTEALTYEQFTRRLFPMAAQVTYAVDRDLVAFTGTVHRDHLAAFYPLFRDMLLAPRMAEADFARVRTQTRADLTLDLRGSSDEELGKEVLQSVLYRNHPYGHPALGTERGLDALTLDLVRAHRARVFCAGRAWAGLSGAVDDTLVQTLREDLGRLPAACAPRVELPAVSAPSGVHVVLVDKAQASSTAISVGLPLRITRADPEHALVQFMTNHLGLHRQSVGVLYQTIREARGLNYGDYAYAEHFAQEGWERFPRAGLLRRQQYASLWLRPVPPRNAHFALRAALRAVERALAGELPQEDVDRVRTFLGGYVSLYTQTGARRLGFAMDDAILGVPEASGPWADRMRAAWAPVTPATLRAAAGRHLSARDVWVAIIAPNARELAAALAQDAPSPITDDSPKPPAGLAEDREIQTWPLRARPEDVTVVPLAEVFR
jgi:zinc protease